MGNSAVKCALEEVHGKKELDLMRRLNPNDYLKHGSGECLEGSLLHLPSELCSNTVSMFESINASFNFIGEVPDELGLYVPHLRHLNLSHNQIVSFPVSSQLLIHLRKLDLSYNRLRCFPACVVALPKLNSLDVSHNKISELPPSVSKMKSLEKLNIGHNNLRALPNCIAESLTLKVIVITGNDLIHPPLTVCEKGSAAIFKFLKGASPAVSSVTKHVQQSVFVRVRGQQVFASVSNPESANKEYRQAQSTSRTNKKKCPLMPPADVSTLSPDQLKDTLLGLIYGATIADAMALNTEGLTEDECEFFYNIGGMQLSERINDFVRSHYPQCDWSSCSDTMLLMLESLMRWGGVVDELEFACQLDQWRIHGLSEVDSRPGCFTLPLIEKVVNAEGFSANPHIIAELIFKAVRAHNVKTGSIEINPSENSCLPPALILGIPIFYNDEEVMMNADRICLTTHLDPSARAACIFIALLTASLLQGIFMSSPDVKLIMDEIIGKVFHYLENRIDKSSLTSCLSFDPCKSPSDVSVTLNLLQDLLLNENVESFEESILRIVMKGGDGATGHACIIGGILGGKNGYSHLPMHWLNQLPKENVRWLNTKMNVLLDLFGLP